MQATFAAVLSLAAVLTATPAIANANTKPVPVEVWRGGDDGLTIKLSESVERALVKDGEFVLSRDKKPGTLIITFPHAVAAVPDGNYVDIDYEVTFSTIEGRKLASIKSGCRELLYCVDHIATTAYEVSQRLSTGPFVLPRDGDYLSTAYIAMLEKTKSHKKAWATGEPQAITVSRDKRGLVLSVNWNWHEGNDTVYDPENPTDQIESGHAFFPGDATRFRYHESKTLTYQYVGSEMKFITDKLLIGTYEDARGRRYVFGSDGKARWPDRTFRFEIYTDMVFEDCDEIWDHDASKPNVPKIYGFAWRGSALHLYNANCPDEAPGCIVDRKHPIAVLHKVA